MVKICLVGSGILIVVGYKLVVIGDILEGSPFAVLGKFWYVFVYVKILLMQV